MGFNVYDISSYGFSKLEKLKLIESNIWLFRIKLKNKQKEMWVLMKHNPINIRRASFCDVQRFAE